MVNQHFAPGELFRFQHLFGWFSEAWCCYVAKESTGSQKMYQVWNMYRWFLKFTLTKGNGTWIEQKTNFICFAFCDLRATVIHHLMFYLPDFDAFFSPSTVDDMSGTGSPWASHAQLSTGVPGARRIFSHSCQSHARAMPHLQVGMAATMDDVMRNRVMMGSSSRVLLDSLISSIGSSSSGRIVNLY